MPAHRRFLTAMAIFWLFFGLGTTFYPRMMQLFMTPEGIGASTPFSDQVWLHEGLDILSVCLLLLALSKLPATKTTMRLAATVGLMPAAAVLYTLLTTPFWKPLFLVPGIACFAFAVYGFMLAARLPDAQTSFDHASARGASVG
jgi:hypothetical protein